MNSYGLGGSLFSGLVQGIMQGHQQATELQQKKDLLKLEQDKIKLQEREAQLRSATDLKTAMMAAESASNVAQTHAKNALDVQRLQGQQSYDTNLMLAGTGLTKTLLENAGNLDVQKERFKNEQTTLKLDPRLQMIDKLQKESNMSYKDAVNLVLGSKEDDAGSRALSAYISSSALTGFNPDTAMQILQFVNKLKGGGGSAPAPAPKFDLSNDKNLNKFKTTGTSTLK